MKKPSSRRVRHIIAVTLFLILAGPARGQIASADLAILHTPATTEPVVEVYAATAPFGFVRPYLISSWEFDNIRPTVITQLAVPTFTAGPLWNSVDVGATWFPFRDYRPTPSASTYVGVRLPIKNVHAFTLFAVQPFIEDWSLIAGVAYTLFYRK